MFTSASPHAEGRKDGYAGLPANRGWYDAVAWDEYMAGYEAGKAARRLATDA